LQEAPDYKDIIKNPMDFLTLKKRVETGLVEDIDAMVNELNLIFDNAMQYNGEGTDYYKMAATLKDLVARQKVIYVKWRAEKGGVGDKPVAAVAAEDDKPMAGKGRRRSGGR